MSSAVATAAPCPDDHPEDKFFASGPLGIEDLLGRQKFLAVDDFLVKFDDKENDGDRLQKVWKFS